jgi:predicted DNA-binding transcriptional regulator AlpA
VPTRKRKTVWDFRLMLEDLPDDDATFDALYEAGCGDGSFGWVEGVAHVDFDREAPTFLDAVISAIRDVESVPPVRVLEVDPDELLTMADIAQRLGRTRESVRLLVRGKRGKGGFPEPVLGTGKWRFWRWSDVLAWLDEVPDAVLERARVTDAVNAALELRRRKVLLPRADRKIIHALAS